jgi:hypothetical protein
MKLALVSCILRLAWLVPPPWFFSSAAIMLFALYSLDTYPPIGFYFAA